MKRKLLFTATTIIAFILLAFCFSNLPPALTQRVQADGNGKTNCTLRKLAGSWSVRATGTVVIPPPGLPAGPFASVGTMEIKEDGSATVKLTRSFNGNIFRETLPGSITLKDDCTGSAVFGGVRTFDIVATSNENEVLFVQTNNGAVVTVELKRL